MMSNFGTRHRRNVSILLSLRRNRERCHRGSQQNTSNYITHQNRVCSFARSNCRLLVCVPWFRTTRGTKLLARTPDGIPPWNAVHLQGTAFRFLICDCTTCLIMVRDPSHAGRQWRIGTHAGRWHASACIWHRDCLLRCYIRGLLLRGTLYVRHISTYATWRLCHRPDERRY